MNAASEGMQHVAATDDGFAIQLARVRKLGREALRTRGARIAGIVLLAFAPVFARWMVAGLRNDEPESVNPFTYTVR